MTAVAYPFRATATAAPGRAVHPEIGLLVSIVVSRARRRLAWLATLEAGVAAGDTPEGELRWQCDSEDGRALSAAVDCADDAVAALSGGRFAELCRRFALRPEECDLLLGGLAPRLDPTVLAFYHQIQSRPWPTEPLVNRLFGHGHRAVWRPDGSLAVWSLLTPGESAPAEPPPLVTDPALPFWLQGDPPLDAALVGHVGHVTPPPPLDDWPVAEAVARLRALRAAGQPVRLIVGGAPGSGRASFAAAVARALGLQALVVHSLPAEIPWQRVWMLVQRQAAVAEAMPIWHLPTPEWPQIVPPAAVQSVCIEPGDPLPQDSRSVDVRVTLPAPNRDTKVRLISRFLPESAAWPAADCLRLAERPGLTVGDLVRLSREQVGGADEAERRLRATSAQSLGDLAERLEEGFDWDDLVLPSDLHESLRDFAFEARARTAFWERPEVRRLFPGGRGLVALFAGPPGTGKTMAAQVIAREIGVDVFRIDLATLMSKYIGETSKNLRQIFCRAAEMHAVLLFDEADALFASRTDVKDSHDRYANTDTNYLLQQLEGFAGIAILASNRKTNIDSAFLRRIRYVYDFPRPDPADRRRLWRELAPVILGGMPAQALALTLDALGDGLELSGAQIKNALVAGHFAARRRGAEPTIVDLMKGIDRELAKEGRALSPRERQRLHSHG
jgi:hypothetical protein